MSKDNVLYALLGVLLGFVAAYFVFETIVERQPARLPAGMNAAAPAVGGAAVGQQPTPQDTQAATAERVRQIEEFVAANPDTAQAWRQLGDLRFDLQRYQPAAEAYQRYLALAPADPDVLTDLGVSFHRMGQAEQALTRFRQAQELAPSHWQSRFNEVVVLAFDLGRPDDAATALQELRRLQPGNPDVERLAEEVERRRSSAS